MKIVILGPDGAGKSSVIDGLMGNHESGGRGVEVRHLKPQILIPQRSAPGTTCTDPHGKPPRSALVSVVKIFIWLVEEWYAHYFQDKKKSLLICDRYYHDLLIDPMRYRYGGAIWIAELVGKLMPQPGLWILLDAPTEALQARKQEVSPEETARQRQAYLAFVHRQRKHVIVDAAQPLERVIAAVETALMECI